MAGGGPPCGPSPPRSLREDRHVTRVPNAAAAVRSCPSAPLAESSLGQSRTLPSGAPLPQDVSHAFPVAGSVSCRQVPEAPGQLTAASVQWLGTSCYDLFPRTPRFLPASARRGLPLSLCCSAMWPVLQEAGRARDTPPVRQRVPGVGDAPAPTCLRVTNQLSFEV